MPYLVVEDFKGGLDHRRSALTSPPGTLRRLIDCHVNRGGEIESRKAFDTLVTLPANTFGLLGDAQLPTVFGSDAPPGSTTGYSYSQILPGGGLSMTGFIAACRFRTNDFVIARLSSGATRHFYNGSPIAATEPVYNELFPVDCMTFKNNVYVLSTTTLYRSKIGDPALWKPTTDLGAFVIDLAPTGLDFASARALGTYEGLLVVYGTKQIQFWSVDPDPAKCVLVRTIENIGILSTLDAVGFVSQKSAVNYGDRDAFFLSPAGVRSLRVRDSSGVATVNDVGSPVDPLLQADFPGPMTVARPAVVDPTDGRYWIAFGDRIFVYSRSDGISAWSEYRPGFAATNMVVANNRIFVRAGDTIYRYGGASGNDYTGVRPEIEFPMLDFGKPATRKAMMGVDMAVEGAVDVFVNCDHTAPSTAWVKVAGLTKSTFEMQRIAAAFHGTHFGLRITTPAPGGYRRVGNAVFHYETGEAG